MFNSLSSLIKSLSRIYVKKNTDISAQSSLDKEEDIKITISFDNVSLKVSGIINTDGIDNISWSEEIFLGPYENLSEKVPVRNLPEALTKALNEIKHRLEGKQNVSISLPVDSIFTRNIQIPKMDKFQILLNAEIKKYIPIPFDEVLLAQNKIASKNEGMLMFFCVAIKKTIFDQYLKIFKNFGINPYMEIGFFSLVRLIKNEDLNKYNLIINIFDDNCLAILSFGKIIMSAQNLNINLNQVINDFKDENRLSFNESKIFIENLNKLKSANKESAKIIEKQINIFESKFSSEIKQSIISFERELNIKIENLYLLGDFDYAKVTQKIKTEFEHELNIQCLNFMQNNLNLNRYTHHLGIAKR